MTPTPDRQPVVFRLKRFGSDGPPSYVEFEPKENGTVEYRIVEVSAVDASQSVTYRQTMTKEEARQQWQRLLQPQCGYQRAA